MLEQRLRRLILKKYKLSERAVTRFMQFLQNYEWLTNTKGYYEIVSGDFYNKENGVMVDCKVLFTPPIAFKRAIECKEKEVGKWLRNKPTSNSETE